MTLNRQLSLILISVQRYNDNTVILLQRGRRIYRTIIIVYTDLSLSELYTLHILMYYTSQTFAVVHRTINLYWIRITCNVGTSRCIVVFRNDLQ